MYEVLKRRLKKKESDETSQTSILPDLLVLDGGIGQLHIIYKILQDPQFSNLQNIQFVSLGKGKARKRSSKHI